MARVFTQTWEGQAAGTTVTLANSGYTPFTGNNATAQFSTVMAANGTRCVALDTANQNVACRLERTFTATGFLVFRRYVQRDTIGALFHVFEALSGATIRAQVRVLANNTIQIRNGQTGVGTSTFAWTSGMIRLEWWLQNGTKNELRIFHGANVHGTTPDETVTNSSTYNEGTFDTFRMGLVTSLANQTVWIDADADDDAAFPGPEVSVSGTLAATVPAVVAALVGNVPTVSGTLDATVPAAVAAFAGLSSVTPGYSSGYTGGYGSAPLGVVSGTLAATVPAAVAAFAGTATPGDPGTLREYRVLVDWDGDGGLDLGNFEGSFDGWFGGGDQPPVLTLSSDLAFQGSQSLRADWVATSTVRRVQREWSGLTAGATYTLNGWAFVPAGSPAVQWHVDTVSAGGDTTLQDAWVEFSHTFTATATSHSIRVRPVLPPGPNTRVYLDALRIMLAGEDVTERRRTSALTFAYGRDYARALATTSPGRASFALDNTSHDYDPENDASPLAGGLLSGRAMLVEIKHRGVWRTVYRGFIDDFDLDPSPGQQTLTLGCLDALARIAGSTVSTALHQSVTTGQAMHVVLDAIGWPVEKRDIDPGATVIGWFWEEGANGFDALQRLVRSEGPPALISVTPDGRFMFRDRHHRLLSPASLGDQTTFREADDDPRLSWPFGYDHGGKEIINSVTFDVAERQPDGELAVVWEDDARAVRVDDGQTVTVTAAASDPFLGAVTPVGGTDYTVRSGVVTVSLSRTSGQATQIRITAMGGPAVVADLKLRAYPVPTLSTVQVQAEDQVSIAAHGVKAWTEDVPWAGRHDAASIARVIVGHRGVRRPTVSVTVLSVSGFNIEQQVNRNLSDRVGVVASSVSLDSAFYVESIAHEVRGVHANAIHTTTFECEQVPSQAADVFVVGSATNGVIGTNRLGRSGLDDPATVFVVGSGSNGVVGVNILGH